MGGHERCLEAQAAAFQVTEVVPGWTSASSAESSEAARAHLLDRGESGLFRCARIDTAGVSRVLWVAPPLPAQTLHRKDFALTGLHAVRRLPHPWFSSS